VTWVDASGGTHTHARGSDELRAMCGGVGVLGVMTELALQLTPPTNTRISTRHLVSDANLAADIDELLKVRGGGVVVLGLSYAGVGWG
jgi:FAD/FMN-containing dehydrogenase